jgi:hypothetical protein
VGDEKKPWTKKKNSRIAPSSLHLPANIGNASTTEKRKCKRMEIEVAIVALLACELFKRSSRFQLQEKAGVFFTSCFSTNQPML